MHCVHVSNHYSTWWFLFWICCAFSVVTVTSSAVCQMCTAVRRLLLACSFKLHPVTTLSPVLQPWQPNPITLSLLNTQDTTCGSFLWLSQQMPNPVVTFRLRKGISIDVAMLKPLANVSSCFASPLMNKV